MSAPLSSPQPARPAWGGYPLLVSDQLLGQQKEEDHLLYSSHPTQKHSEEAAC